MDMDSYMGNPASGASPASVIVGVVGGQPAYPDLVASSPPDMLPGSASFVGYPYASVPDSHSARTVSQYPAIASTSQLTQISFWVVRGPSACRPRASLLRTSKLLATTCLNKQMFSNLERPIPQKRRRPFYPLKNLVQKITESVERLELASPTSLEVPSSGRKRASSPSIQTDRPIKALRGPKIEPPDDGLLLQPGLSSVSSSVQPFSAAVLPPAVPPPMIAPGTMTYDVTTMPLSSELASHPSPTTWTTSSTALLHAHPDPAGTIVPISGTIQSQNGVMSPLRMAAPQEPYTNGYANGHTPGALDANPYDLAFAPPLTVAQGAPAKAPLQSPTYAIPSHSPPELPPTIAPPIACSCPSAPTSGSCEPEEEGEDADDDDDQAPDNAGQNHPPPADIPAEYEPDVRRIFFDFLADLCSDLQATDSKGEAIHQTLMAKKMKRLDESNDYRPFKFRIAAFTSKFLERLAEEGYPEDKLPMKKACFLDLHAVRNYLWHQPYILRFNEEGKKAKSKGNPHLGRGIPKGVAYRGLEWRWKARIWDPQNAWHDVRVNYTSPNLPSWLQWTGDELHGTPDLNATSCDITIIAKFNFQGQDGEVNESLHITVAPENHSPPAQPARLTPPQQMPSPPSASRQAQGVPQRPSPGQRSYTDGALPTSSPTGLTGTFSVAHEGPRLPDSLRQLKISFMSCKAPKVQTNHELQPPYPLPDNEIQQLSQQMHVFTATIGALTQPASPHTEAGPAQAALLAAQDPRPPNLSEVSQVTKLAVAAGGTHERSEEQRGGHHVPGAKSFAARDRR
ncbi:hypothetical protein DL96DRAFT_1802499 [Flagelloscypha sp. PMI_526]|nr:hypothetical protein DL96DRAFT_1802499 [Flagelloscypha sp. PMI_526]